ncbi:MAG: hypothetical protein J5I93_23025 [Pirellulaceae bacterium]|nr:hypothetical protein [Pirellulaceae bacterium]
MRRLAYDTCRGWILMLGCLAGLAGGLAALPGRAAADDAPQRAEGPLEGTRPLTWSGDLASQMIDGIDAFLLRQLAASVEQRANHWRRDVSSPEAYEKSVAANRRLLAQRLGVRDERLPVPALELLADTRQPALVGTGPNYKIFAVRWPVLGEIQGEGLLLVPDGDQPPRANVIAVPDADQTPEMVAGLVAGVPAESQFARRLAENGCRVVVPVLIDRRLEARNGRAKLTSREFLYRSAFELGRGLVGYELQKVLAVADWFSRPGSDSADVPLGVIGWGEGGLLALYAGALDTRLDAVCVSGYFGSRQEIWQEPLDRNVFGLLEQFGDAELATLIAPRALIVEACHGPELELPSEGGAPARLVTADPATVAAELERARRLIAGLDLPFGFRLVASGDGRGPFGSDAALAGLLEALQASGGSAASQPVALAPTGAAPRHLRAEFDPAARQKRQFDQIDRHNQWLLLESPYVRAEFMKRLDTNSLDSYRETSAEYRELFRREVIGHFDQPLLPRNPRTRQAYDTPRWTGYEVVLDVLPDVFAYGILLLPKDLKPGEKRPVVVCQHGLEGRPQEVVEGDHRAYHDFAAKLAERGFITFAPQNIYIFKDRFRTLQRKSYPLKKTLFSTMVAQHQQITDWLASLPQVDPRRIGFYGLSYGGKSAMRIPALVDNYCLSICSADFNEWVWKNASSRAPHSYVWTGEYEIFEFDLGSTFNYAEMAALIAPRPFMVERGHFDGVAPDETVAYEFAKVRHLYAARLGIGDRCEIEWFVGPHTINGQATFDFLHRHLNWPAQRR